MKIFANKYIKQFFISILICAAVYAAAALSIVFSGLDNAAVWVFLLSALMAVGVLAVSLNYFIKQNRSIEQASLQVRNYLSGDRTARIDCMREGELYRLFHEVNNLVAALNARAENELRAKEFMKDTISDISHQLKTPVAALNIYNGLIQAEGEDLPEIKNLAELSEKELDRIEVLIQNLLKITRFDAEAIVLNRSMENVAEMMNRVREQFAFRARSEDKRIELSGEDGVMLLCDRDWILEAVCNIVKNALDHTAPGGRIDIMWKEFASVVQVVIKDDGAGIHPEDICHIFKRFYRSRFSQDVQGIGLGLPLAKTIVEANNGSIEVDSELGKGSVFTINFLITTDL